MPSGLTDPQGRPAGKRFAVYRNNVAVSLTEALETAFPVVRKLVGEEFFKAMAGVYLRQHPPTSALMMYYGARVSGVSGRASRQCRPSAIFPMSRDWNVRLRQSYHAADAAPIDPAILQAMPPDQLMAARLSSGARGAVWSGPAWPIYALWLANTTARCPEAADAARGRADHTPGLRSERRSCLAPERANSSPP